MEFCKAEGQKQKTGSLHELGKGPAIRYSIGLTFSKEKLSPDRWG